MLLKQVLTCGKGAALSSEHSAFSRQTLGGSDEHLTVAPASRRQVVTRPEQLNANCLLLNACLFSSPHEMDDLKFVSIVEFSCWPGRTRNDVVIEFDGDAIGLHAEMIDKRGETQAVRKGLCVAVDRELHQRNSSNSLLSAREPEFACG